MVFKGCGVKVVLIRTGQVDVTEQVTDMEVAFVAPRATVPCC